VVMKKKNGNNDQSQIVEQIEKLERKIKMLEDEEQMWGERETFINDLIKDREKEIETMKSMLQRMYEKKNSQNQRT
jgi:hypothetical protein